MTHCFVCARCEFPICGRDDLLTTSIPQGTTKRAFGYELEDLLGVEDGVPCYCAEDRTRLSVVLSPTFVTVPMPDDCVALAMNAVVESSRRYGELALSAFRDRFPDSDVTMTTERDAVNAAAAEVLGTVAGSERQDPDGEGASNAAATAPEAEVAEPLIRHYGLDREERIDLVCVKSKVLQYGMNVSSRARDKVRGMTEATGAPSPDGESSSSEEFESSDSSADGEDEEVLEEEREEAIARREHAARAWREANRSTDEAGWGEEGNRVLPRQDPADDPAVVPVASTSEPQPRLRGSAGASAFAPRSGRASSTPSRQRRRRRYHPGNMKVDESYASVVRITASASLPWFNHFSCVSRLECPDCHMALGYLFASEELLETLTTMKHDDMVEYLMMTRVEGVDDVEAPKESPESDAAPPSEADGFPSSFCAMELKRVRQRVWGLHDMQRRYHQAQNIGSFRQMFPEAEELQSLLSRLIALRTQCELYNNLLRKHKEQTDVQTALLRSQKDRIGTYEEKLKTMQQIIEAQRQQLEMQTKHIFHQEELVRNHKNQVATQQRQITVEQLLLSEQSKTIQAQQQQLRLFEVHMRATRARGELAGLQAQLTLPESEQAQPVPPGRDEPRTLSGSGRGETVEADVVSFGTNSQPNTGSPTPTLSEPSPPAAGSIATAAAAREEKPVAPAKVSCETLRAMLDNRSKALQRVQECVNTTRQRLRERAAAATSAEEQKLSQSLQQEGSCSSQGTHPPPPPSPTPSAPHDDARGDAHDSDELGV